MRSSAAIAYHRLLLYLFLTLRCLAATHKRSRTSASQKADQPQAKASSRRSKAVDKEALGHVEQLKAKVGKLPLACHEFIWHVSRADTQLQR